MSSDQLRNKIMKKYDCNRKEWIGYLLVDAMLTYYNEIHDSHTMLKGALSLFKGYNYRRRELTRDIDISLINFSIDDFVKEIKNTSPMKVDEYTFKFVDSKKNMLDKEYPGYQIRINFNVGGMGQNFKIDLSVEELEEYNDISKGIYSLERTLIDKVSTALYYGIDNSRFKDYEDLKEFLDKSDIKIIKEMLPKLNSIRKRSVEQVETFIDTIDDICDKFDSHDIKDILLDLANHSLEALKSE